MTSSMAHEPGIREAASVSALNELLVERAGFGREQQVAVLMAYLVHAIVLLAVMLVVRRSPPMLSATIPGVMHVTPLYGSPDGDGAAPTAELAPSTPPPQATPVSARPTPPIAKTRAAPPKVAEPVVKPKARRPVQERTRKAPADPAPAVAPVAAGNDESERRLAPARAAEGSPLGRLDGTSGGGFQSLLWSNQFYVKKVQDNVYRNWANPFLGRRQPDAELAVIVLFRIQRSGRVTDVNLGESSGNALFDRSGLRAVKNARLPPLPADFPGREVQVRYRFSLAR